MCSSDPISKIRDSPTNAVRTKWASSSSSSPPLSLLKALCSLWLEQSNLSTHRLPGAPHRDQQRDNPDSLQIPTAQNSRPSHTRLHSLALYNGRVCRFHKAIILQSELDHQCRCIHDVLLIFSNPATTPTILCASIDYHHGHHSDIFQRPARSGGNYRPTYFRPTRTLRFRPRIFATPYEQAISICHAFGRKCDARRTTSVH